jgi:hypothetical protein
MTAEAGVRSLTKLAPAKKFAEIKSRSIPCRKTPIKFNTLDFIAMPTFSRVLG